jgi:exodeoxyribonuclease VII large subunit
MSNGVGETGSQVIYSVTQITDKIKSLLEVSFPFIWITGEISNFSSPMSGHIYFSLKDENAQINAVMFRGQNRNLKFAPNNGMAVTGLGRISLYKPRGTYQIIFEYLEPQGVGALQVAFEQLKARLADEGIFDEKRKKPLPFLPRKIALITSPTGAVLHDMMKITRRRFENMRLVVVPVKVQGAGAVEDITAAIELVNRWGGADVAILARGGGSLEDLQAFNSEPVARAIAASELPIVSAVGHETDYTISDFVSDLRAPTPSAAAEMLVPDKGQLIRYLFELKEKLCRIMEGEIDDAASDLKYLTDSLVDPVKKVQELGMRCDELQGRLFRSFENGLDRQREVLKWQTDKLYRAPISSKLTQYKNNISYLNSVLLSSFTHRFEQAVSRHNSLQQKLNALSPLSILDRGYSITRTVTGKQIVRRQDQVEPDQLLEIILSKGRLEVSVKKKNDSDGVIQSFE